MTEELDMATLATKIAVLVALDLEIKKKIVELTALMKSQMRAEIAEEQTYIA